MNEVVTLVDTVKGMIDVYHIDTMRKRPRAPLFVSVGVKPAFLCEMYKRLNEDQTKPKVVKLKRNQMQKGFKKEAEIHSVTKVSFLILCILCSHVKYKSH